LVENGDVLMMITDVIKTHARELAYYNAEEWWHVEWSKSTNR